MAFSSIIQNDGLKPKIFCDEMGTKHPLNKKVEKFVKFFFMKSHYHTLSYS